MSSLVVHVPHASTVIPDDVWAEFLVPRSDVEAEAFASADLYTDEMARRAWPCAQIIEAEVSRIVVDVERYDDDSQEEMSEVGRGVLYTHDHQRKAFRKNLSKNRRDKLLARHYRPHWQHLRAQAAGAILIDLHTYPAEPWPIELRTQGQRPEIDIGFTKGLTPHAWVVRLRSTSESMATRLCITRLWIGVEDWLWRSLGDGHVAPLLAPGAGGGSWNPVPRRPSRTSPSLRRFLTGSSGG